MRAELILTNACVVLEDALLRGTLVARDGRIVEVSAGASRAAGAEDLGGNYLTAGLIELHTDNAEIHLMPRPGVLWPKVPAILSHDAALAAAGITTVLDAISCGSDHVKQWRANLCDAAISAIDIARERGHLRADHLLHLRCEVVANDMQEQFERNIAHPLVRLVSLMDHTPGARQFVDAEKFREYYMGKHGFSEDELEEMIAARRANQGQIAASRRAGIAQRCRDQGITLASHDDATAEHIAEAAGLGVTISEFPTTRAAAAAAHARGLRTIVGAPNMVRGGSHSGNVAAHELAGAQLLDCFSSDYVPSSLMQAAWLLNTRLDVALPAALATVTSNPAAMLGLADRGSLTAGKRADLVEVADTPDGPVVRRVWREGVRVV